jgi:hypothetical protein
MDDGSSSFTAAVALNGITSIVPGESVIFIETADLPGTAAVFVSTWVGTSGTSSPTSSDYVYPADLMTLRHFMSRPTGADP